MEAEHRLWPFLICLFFVPGALLLWGVGAAHQVHWFGLIFAMGMLSFCNTTGITISVNYMIDSYRELSGEAMATVIIIRNTMSFAIGYGYEFPLSLENRLYTNVRNSPRITPWIGDLGYQNCFISAAFIGLTVSAVFLIMVKWGKSFRVRSREKYWALVTENWEKGMGH
jgi:hypothetical protein